MNICLSMIVKNEARVIERVLTSVLPLIDSWTIVDTGSTDSTREIIQAFFERHNVPGKLHHFEWTGNFSEARNFALRATEESGADYGFWIDADEEMFIGEAFNRESAFASRKDAYCITTRNSTIEYNRKNIWKTGLGFIWTGPIHEYLSSPNEKSSGVLSNAFVKCYTDGASWADVQKKYAEHARALSAYCEHTPDPRWVFYAAQSYKDAGMVAQAIEWYERRALMLNGFFEERYVSKCAVANLNGVLKADVQTRARHFIEAHALDPLRGEAIKGLTQLYIDATDWQTAYIYSTYGLRYNKTNPYPHRVLFLTANYYDFEALEMHALCAYYANHKQEAAATYWKMREQIADMGEGRLNADQLRRIRANEPFYIKGA